MNKAFLVKIGRLKILFSVFLDNFSGNGESGKGLSFPTGER
jgi:hypothetical protein